MAFWKKWFGQSNRKQAAAEAQAAQQQAAADAAAAAQAAALKRQEQMLEEQRREMERLEGEKYKGIASRRRAIMRGGGANLLSPERPTQSSLGVAGMLGSGANLS